jgi:hypothetical protein
MEWTISGVSHSMGGPPQQLPRFSGDRIADFDWSSDGKSLAVMRGSGLSDVLLIRDTGVSDRLAK